MFVVCVALTAIFNANSGGVLHVLHEAFARMTSYPLIIVNSYEERFIRKFVYDPRVSSLEREEDDEACDMKGYCAAYVQRTNDVGFHVLTFKDELVRENVPRVRTKRVPCKCTSDCSVNDECPCKKGKHKRCLATCHDSQEASNACRMPACRKRTRVDAQLIA